MATMHLCRPLEEAATAVSHSTTVALVQIYILPIRNRFLGELPEATIQDAKLMVVNRHVHAAQTQGLDSVTQFGLIVLWINP